LENDFKVDSSALVIHGSKETIQIKASLQMYLGNLIYISVGTFLQTICIGYITIEVAFWNYISVTEDEHYLP
jgi:hypothetical protein